jgi:restriction endonuclease Mrr
VTFRKVCVTTQYFNAGAHEHARHNNVQLIDQAALRKLMAEHEIALTDVEGLLYRDWTARS